MTYFGVGIGIGILATTKVITMTPVVKGALFRGIVTSVEIVTVDTVIVIATATTKYIFKSI